MGEGEITLHPFQTSDLPGVISLLRNELPAHEISESLFVRKVLLDQNFDPEMALVAREPGGAIAGFLLAIARKLPLEGGADDRQRGWITLFAVRKDLRRRTIATQLFDEAERLLQERNAREIWVSPYTPNYWTPGVDEAAYPEAIAFLASRGYTAVSRPLAMSAPLQPDWKVPAWAIDRESALRKSAALAIRPITGDLVLPLMDFLSNEFPGDWLRHIREAVAAIYSGHWAAENVLVAVSGNEVCGFAHMDGERFGPFGVGNAQRGMGVGALLLYRSMESMHRRSAKRAWFMWTGDGPAERIYKPAGFVETNRFAVMMRRQNV